MPVVPISTDLTLMRWMGDHQIQLPLDVYDIRSVKGQPQSPGMEAMYQSIACRQRWPVRIGPSRAGGG
jgi:hypothetical protein